MLVNTFGKKISASLVAKNSQFYIEVAKFVQAYSIILNNPNDFLSEIGEQLINEEKEKLSWNSLSKIMQTCDFGFVEIPTNSDLLVFYNYAVEIGSISSIDKRIATVDDVADAQKNYYNFVDEAKDRAEAEFLKQQKINQIREKEVFAVNSKLKSYTSQKWLSFSFMIISVIFFCLGLTGLFVGNSVIEIVSSAICIVLSIVMFYFSDRWFFKSRHEFMKLEHASSTLFSRNNNNFITEQVLKFKFENLKKDLQDIRNELSDENKTFDVKTNIERLAETNEYYKKYYHEASFFSAESHSHQIAMQDQKVYAEDEQAEHETQEIMLEGMFDEEAYNEKFEITNKKSIESVEQEQTIEEEKQEIIEENQNKDKKETERENQEEIQRIKTENDSIEQQEEMTEEQIDIYINYLRDILGDDTLTPESQR